MGLALIGDCGLVTANRVHSVGNLLGSAIREGNVVRSRGLVSVPCLLLTIVVVGWSILDGPIEVIGSRGVIGGCRLVRAGLVGPGKGNSGKGGNGNEGLKNKEDSLGYCLPLGIIYLRTLLVLVFIH